VDKLNKDAVTDPLNYQEIVYDLAEWDNIPSIITKFCLNLDRYMKSTVSYLAQQKHDE